MQLAYEACMATCDTGTVAVCQPCVIPSVLKGIALNAMFALTLATDLSAYLYAEIVDAQDGDAAAEQDTAVYKNVITNHGNIITTFNLLRDVAAVHGIQAGTGASRRRMQVIDCTNTASGYIDNCRKPSCEDPTRFCDGSFNHEYISQLEGGENHNRTM